MSQTQNLNVNGNTLFHHNTVTSLEKNTKRDEMQNSTEHHII